MSRFNLFCFIMDTKQTTSQSLKFGIYTGLGLIFYFLLMKVLGFHKYLELHYLNMIFLFFGLLYSIKKIKLISGELKYFEGLKIGILVTLTSIIIFNLFLLIYEFFIDPSFLTLLQDKLSFGFVKSPAATSFIVFGIIFIEGLSSGFIITYILMQYYKNDHSESS